MASSKPNRQQSILSKSSLSQIKRTLLECIRGGGKILQSYFGNVTNPRAKESPSSIVCDADLASERFVLETIRRWFPNDNIISEESGCTRGSTERTWVIDPLDGTSNFVAGLPWFGIQIGVLHGGRPVLAAMYLPTDRVLYFAQAGQGVTRNGRPVTVTAESNLQNVLCAFGFDPAAPRRNRQAMELLQRVSSTVRNTRATNSLVDFCYTVDGRLGACINLKTMIWDIVPVALMLPEAGGKFTYLTGEDIAFSLEDDCMKREYAVLGASQELHAKLLATCELPSAH
jgi:myo-inositol-1(or 4)-monophosphatase